MRQPACPPCPHSACSIVALCRDRPGLLRQFEGQNISNLLWGFCRAGFRPDGSFLQDIAEVGCLGGGGPVPCLWRPAALSPFTLTARCKEGWLAT